MWGLGLGRKKEKGVLLNTTNNLVLYHARMVSPAPCNVVM
jgi:hypothetical protein